MMLARMIKSLFCTVIVVTLSSSVAANAADFDWVLRGGLIVDGSGDAPFVGTIAIKDKRLQLRAGDAPDWVGASEIDVNGRVIAPGFIDLHTHAGDDLLDPQHGAMENYLSQGVTTVVVGNDGGGTLQIDDRFAALAEHGTGTHVVQYVGHASLRRAVMPRTNRAATPEEIAEMRELIARAMAQGAVGLSSGLFYADGSFATTEEMIELCREVVRHGGIYDSHIRAESSRGVGLVAAIDEAIEIGRQSGVPVHIAHIKALGRDVWGQASMIVERIEKARDEGLRVTADQYPWVASSTRLVSASLSRKWQSGGPEVWRAKLLDPATRADMLSDMRDNIDRRGGPESLMLLGTMDERWHGLRLDQIASEMGMTAEEAAAKLLATGSPGVISFNMQEDDIAVFMQRPWVATSSNGSDGHPRKYGSFPRKYRRYVRELELLSLEEFVRSSSGLAADILGLENRGYLRNGYHADVVVFDPERFREEADFENWNRTSQGVELLFVDGVPAIQGGAFTGNRAGSALRRAAAM